jgi:hypothetical protein
MFGNMSVNSIMMPQQMVSQSQYNNTEDVQEIQSTISSILENYDSENLTQEDALEIVDAIEAAGIRPSRALGEAMANEGFDAKEIGDLAGIARGDMPPPPPPPSNTEDTEDLQDILASILEEYDSENLTQEDALEIIDALEAAGIRPSRELGEAMAEEGFDAKEIGDLAGITRGDMPPPPPPPSGEDDSSFSGLLSELLDSEDDENSVYSEADDYSNKIAHLNEQSKSEVEDMLNMFSNIPSDINNQQKTDIIKHTLNSILDNSNNYNRFSMYA